MGANKNNSKTAKDKFYTIEVNNKKPKSKSNKQDNKKEKEVQQPVSPKEETTVTNNKTEENVVIIGDKKENNNLTVVKETNLAVSKKLNDYENNNKSTGAITKVVLIILSLLVIVFLAFSIFTIYNTTSSKIANGVFVKGVNVSGLTKESAKNAIETFINEHSSDEIVLKHNDFESSISLEQINASFDIDSAIEQAYNINRNGNFLVNTFNAIKTLILHTNIEPELKCDEEQLTKSLSDISPNLPDTIIDSSYYIEDNTLVATKGRTGCVVDVDKMKDFVKKQIYDLNFTKPLNIITIEKSPKPLDMDAIYNEIHKEAKDAYFTQEPLAFYPSEEGIDFAISLDEAKKLVETTDGECDIPLQILQPNVTTNMIGNEAFPDQLSEYSTRYVSNPSRTTNLSLAASKINGTVVMPGEVFSYNKVVGERTIAAGYKDAAIYVDGQTVDGLGGGICQVTTTLYEAVLYANLEIVERMNHQFVPSYIGAGLDATVVYGSIDFQFKNNRNYPIKILCSVANGTCYFQILGLATPDDCQVQISASSSKTATSINSVTYKTLLRNGQVISSDVISRDTYKRH